ncbi:transposase [Actinacidiphila oryziradicis]|nr:transposase [Actinacidiphila oryziradicis]
MISRSQCPSTALRRQGTSRPAPARIELPTGCVHLVVDWHSAHRSKRVRAWLAAHPDDVDLHFRPPYSPELSLGRANLCRSQAQPAQAVPGPEPGRTRRRDRRFFRRRRRRQGSGVRSTPLGMSA